MAQAANSSSSYYNSTGFVSGYSYPIYPPNGYPTSYYPATSSRSSYVVATRSASAVVNGNANNIVGYGNGNGNGNGNANAAVVQPYSVYGGSYSASSGLPWFHSLRSDRVPSPAQSQAPVPAASVPAASVPAPAPAPVPAPYHAPYSYYYGSRGYNFPATNQSAVFNNSNLNNIVPANNNNNDNTVINNNNDIQYYGHSLSPRRPANERIKDAQVVSSGYPITSGGFYRSYSPTTFVSPTGYPSYYSGNAAGTSVYSPYGGIIPYYGGASAVVGGPVVFSAPASALVSAPAPVQVSQQ